LLLSVHALRQSAVGKKNLRMPPAAAVFNQLSSHARKLETVPSTFAQPHKVAPSAELLSARVVAAIRVESLQFAQPVDCRKMQRPRTVVDEWMVG
jgi:hypothetical protein